MISGLTSGLGTAGAAATAAGGLLAKTGAGTGASASGFTTGCSAAIADATAMDGAATGRSCKGLVTGPSARGLRVGARATSIFASGAADASEAFDVKSVSGLVTTSPGATATDGIAFFC